MSGSARCGRSSAAAAARAAQRAWLRFQEMLEEQGGSTSVSTFCAVVDGEETEEPAESVTSTRLWWRKPDHVRLEHAFDDAAGRLVEVAAGRRWWSWSPDWGATSSDREPGARSGAQDTPFPQLLDPSMLMSELVLDVVGPAVHAGRRAIAVRGRARRREVHGLMVARLEGGADAYELLVDLERGVVLRVASEVEGEVFAAVEIQEVAFDESFDPATFTLELPAGEEFRPSGFPGHDDVTLDEAARRAPFTVLVPRRVPREAEMSVTFVTGSDRPRIPAGVHIAYRVDRGGYSVDVSQSAADDSDALAPDDDDELVERDGRTVRVHDMAGHRQLETELEGTHVLIVSRTMPVDPLVEMALSLEPAPTEPPALS